jgi:TfoX/Sxy family transcriptional regulator of competence genes
MAETIYHKDSIFNDGQSLWCFNLKNHFKMLSQKTFYVKTMKKSKTKTLSLGEHFIQYSKHVNNIIYPEIYKSHEFILKDHLQIVRNDWIHY